MCLEPSFFHLISENIDTWCSQTLLLWMDQGSCELLEVNLIRPKMQCTGRNLVGHNSWLITDSRDFNKARFQYWVSTKKQIITKKVFQFWPHHFFLLWMLETEEMINFYIREMFRKTDETQSIQDSYFDQNFHITNTNRSTQIKCGDKKWQDNYKSDNLWAYKHQSS